LWSRDVIDHVTIRLPKAEFIWVVHGDHASIRHSYGDMAPQILNAWIWTQKNDERIERERGRGGKGKGKGKWKRKRKKKGKENRNGK